jgi:alpha-L-rhamnosidase
MMTVTNLRCEYQANPMGLDIVPPRLSWQLQSDRRGARQTAYQIIAAASEQAARHEQSILWDSGRTKSDQSVHVPYAGEPLASGQRMWWKVRVWDEHDQPTTYSDLAWWEMGLLNRDDWQGQWIGASLVGGKYTTIPCPFLRREFVLEQTVISARLYITALGLYGAYLNGQSVGQDVLASGWTDYQHRVRYQVYDVTSLVTSGRNAIGVILGDGWYCGHVAWYGRQLYGDRPRLLAQLHCTLADGTTTIIPTDNTWKTAFGPILESDLFMGESYDARLEFPNWHKPGFTDARWQPVEIFDQPDIALVAHNGPTVRRIQELQPVADPIEIPARNSTQWIFDFGQNMVGRVRLKVNGPAGATVTLRHGEMLDADGCLYTENLRGARQTDHYTLRGDGEEIYEPHFTFHGFRYVEISGLPYKPTRDTLTGIVLYSDLPLTGDFECSNALVNRLQHNITWSQKGNLVDIPTDCPQRDERLGWTGDAQVFIRTATFNMNVAAFFTKWQQDLADSQYSSGAIPPFAPNTDLFQINSTKVPGGPAWEDAFVICPWIIHLCYGDKRPLKTHYRAMARFIDYLSNKLSKAEFPIDGGESMPGGYGDWLATDVPPDQRVGATPKDLIAVAFAAYSTRLMSQIAAALGKSQEADAYDQRFQEIRRLFNERYVTSAGLITGQTQTGYVLALHFDLLPDELRPIAVQELVRNIEEHNMHLTTGFVGTPYLLHVLTAGGRVDVAYKLLLQETWPSWLYPVTQGATTIWERWDGWTHDRGFQDPQMNSFNHYAYGAIGAWLYAVVAGIEPDPNHPGFKHIILRPQPGGGLTSARATHASMYGKIVSHWNIQEGVFDWQITIPPNTTATIYLPTTEISQITEGEVSLDQAPGTTVLREEAGTIVCKVAPGNYHFRAIAY